MNRRRLAIVAVGLMLAILLSSFCVPLSAEGQTVAPDLSFASAVCFYHIESEQQILGKQETSPMPAGSTVKLMSGLLFCEIFSQQKADVFEITEEMIRHSTGRKFRMKAGELYTAEELLYIALCGSCNDAYDTLAYLVGGGDKSVIVDLMNQRAAEWGLTDTLYGDYTGLADNSFTTARDLCTLALRARENAYYMAICSAEQADISQGRVYNANALLSRREDTRYYNTLCRGLTAGSTTAGGYSLVTLTERENDHYLCVVLGASREEGEKGKIHSYEIASDLIEWGYDSYAYLELLSPETEICSLPVTVSDLTDSVAVRATESFHAYLPSDTVVGEDVTFSIRLTYETLEAPVTVGEHVGYLAIVYQGRVLGTVSLYTAEEATRSGFVSRLMAIRTLTESRAVRAGLCFFVLATAAWILTEFLIRRHKRRKWDRYFSSKIDLPETIMQERRK